MNISIHGEIIAYHSDYSATSKLWKVHLRDAFRMVTLGSTECFVKRFASKPRAWDFMVASKGKRQTGLPIIYDAVSTTEDGKLVFYLFLERIEGDTLHDLMKDKAGKVSVSLLAKALTAGFRTFHSQGYWHADFCAKNIMVAAGGRRYVVIDLDSLEPITNRPTPTPNEPGYIPDQELALYALTYVQLYSDPKIKSFSSIPGPVLNQLQLVFLLDKLTYFSCVLKAEGAKFRQLAAFKDLPQLVHRYLGGYTNQLVKRILDRTADSEMVLTQPVFFEKELPGQKTSSPSFYFKALFYSILPGQSTVLSWEVPGGVNINITSFGHQAAKGRIIIQNRRTGDVESEETYTLTANGGTIKKAITIKYLKSPSISARTPFSTRLNTIAPSVVPSVVTLPPVATINTFSATSYFVEAGEQTVISWNVSAAGNVYISNIGTVPAVGSMSFHAWAFNGLVEFELIAGDPAVKKSLSIEFSAQVVRPSILVTTAKQQPTVSPVLLTQTSPAILKNSKPGIWPFIIAFGLILMLIGFLLPNKSASIAADARGFMPNQESVQDEDTNTATESPEATASWPSIDSKYDNDIAIKQVVQLETSTRVDFVYLTTKQSQKYIFLKEAGHPDALYIIWAGDRYELIKTTGIGGVGGETYAYAEKPVHFSAYFEKIPETATEIDIREGVSGTWEFNGVHLVFR